MWSQCEPSQSWNAASVQEGLTWIDGKNCTQIIKRGHPHVTKKVMLIKMTHLFELYISAHTLNREPLNTRRISKSFHWFFKGIKSTTSFCLMCCVLTPTLTHLTPLHVYKSGGPPAPNGAFSKIPKPASIFGEIMSPHSKISCNQLGKLRFDIIPPSPVKLHQHIEHISQS